MKLYCAKILLLRLSQLSGTSTAITIVMIVIARAEVAKIKLLLQPNSQRVEFVIDCSAKRDSDLSR